MGAEFFCFTLMAVPHADDAPGGAARRPCKDDKSIVKPTGRDEARFTVVLAVVCASEMRAGKDVFGAEQIQAPLLKRPSAFGGVARDPHGLNVATENGSVKPRECMAAG